MFTLWYLSLGWKEYNKPFRIQSPDDKKSEEVKKPDLIPEKKVPEPPEPPKPKTPEPPPPKQPEPPKPKPQEPPPKQPEPPKPKPQEPPPKQPSPPKPKPQEPPPKQPSPPKPKPQEPVKPKSPTSPGAKAPDFPSPKPQPSKTPEPSKPGDRQSGRQSGNSGVRPSDFNGAGPKGDALNKNPRDLSYGKFESGENLPDRNFHLTEAKFQENLKKKYVEEPVISNPDSLESSEEED